jgi:hypothetical protein
VTGVPPALTAQVATNTADIFTLQGQMIVANAAILTLQGQMTTANSNIVALAPKYSSMAKTNSQSIGALSTAFVNITGYDTFEYSANVGVNANLANGTMSISTTGNYNIFVFLAVSLTADPVNGRTFNVRIYDVSAATQVGAVEIVYVAPLSLGVTPVLMLPTNITATNHVYRIEIGGASTFAGVVVQWANFTLNRVSA